MELYLDVRAIGKGEKGRTACGSAAYRCCGKIIDNDGRHHNYYNKGGYVAGDVLLPAGAPEELRSRQTLWQRHDAKEIRKDAQIYREVIVALPNELSDEACMSVVTKLISPLIEMGMCGQVDIHNAHPKDRREEENNAHPENKHAHVMLTMRELLSDGTFGKKNREWNKYGGGVNLADALRPEAARLMNEELRKIGSDKMVEHESYASRGIDKIPQIHVGVAGIGIDRRGETSYRKQLNDVIQALNKKHLSYVERIQRLRDARAELSANFAAKANEKRSLFDQIAAGEDLTQTTIAEQQAAIDRDYQEIQECNQRIYDLRKEKKQTDKLRKALYTYRNLAGDQNLTQEQEEQLQWARGYICWATKEEPSVERVEDLIETVRENNTQRCLDLAAAEKSKKDAFNEIAAARSIVSELRREEYRKNNQR